MPWDVLRTRMIHALLHFVCFVVLEWTATCNLCVYSDSTLAHSLVIENKPATETSS